MRTRRVRPPSVAGKIAALMPQHTLEREGIVKTDLVAGVRGDFQVCLDFPAGALQRSLRRGVALDGCRYFMLDASSLARCVRGHLCKT